MQSWVARCAQVPVTTYQKSCYLQPQTTCCTTTPGALIPMNGAMPGNGAMAAPPMVNAVVPNQPPQVDVNPPPSNQYQNPQIRDQAPAGPNVGNMSLSQPRYAYPGQHLPQNWQAAPKQPAPATPAVKLDRIVFGPESLVEGQIVRNDRTPRAGANILFVSADSGTRHAVTANGSGQFQTRLASGSYLVYVPNADGTPLFHSRVNVRDNQPTRLSLSN